MVSAAVRRSDELAGVSLLAAVLGCMVGVGGALAAMWPVVWTGVGLIVAGGGAVGVFVYRASCQSQTGIARSFGRSAVIMVKMVLEIVIGTSGG